MEEKLAIARFGKPLDEDLSRGFGRTLINFREGGRPIYTKAFMPI
jgi:hypothetical protein